MVDSVISVWWLVAVPLVAVGILLFVFRGRLSRFAGDVQFERARELFKLQKEKLHHLFFQAASASGKPRGLLWKACEWEPAVEYVRDRKTKQIVAFAGVTIHFDAEEGTDMAGNPNVSLPRNASAVFYFDRGQWHTSGLTVMNKNPDEAAAHFTGQYERLGSHEV